METEDNIQTEVPEQQSEREETRLFRLLLVHGPNPRAVGSVHLLDELPLTLGRASEFEHERGVTLPDSHASRRHAIIEATAHGTRVRDLGSSNGTYVNGRATPSAELNEGDVLRVGSHLFVIQVLDQATRQAMTTTRRSYPGLIGESCALLRVSSEIERFARKPFPVLILGQTGVGKEVVARAIHDASGRTGAFVPINCASLPANLIESELFGHEAGAFTGAQHERAGLFDEAEGGTILLDEIGDMPPALQVSLLRVLATGEIRRVGGRRPRRTNARVVAATHVDLASKVEQGSFRGDLYARLRGAVIQVPRLRDRREDILRLAATFLTRAGAAAGLSAAAAEALLTYDWPFNVRELEQVMTVAAAEIRRGEVVDTEQLPSFLKAKPAKPLSQQEPRPVAPHHVAEILRVAPSLKPSAEDLRSVLRHFDGNVAQAAAYFRKDRRQIYRWCEQMGIDPNALRTES